MEESSQYKLYKKRFLISFLYCLALFVTSFLMNTATPIAANLQFIYDYDSFVINLSGLFFLLMHPIFTFPAAFIIDRLGIKYCIKIGAILSLVGCWIRLLINYSFIFVLVGQVIAGSGRPFIINCQAKVSANWFYASNRTLMTSLFTFMINASLILGIIIPGIMFHKFNWDREQGRKLSFNLMLYEAIISSLFLIPNLLFQKDKPPTPPSQIIQIKKQPFISTLKSLIHNKNYLHLLFGFCMFFGIFNAISINLAFIIKPWFKENISTATTWIGTTPIITGFIGVIVFSFIQKKLKIYKKLIIVCMIGSCIAIVSFYPCLQTNNLVIACLVSMLNSFFLIPLVPIMLELSCEIGFPAGQGMTVGIMIAGGNLFGFVLGMILSIITRGQSKKQSLFGIIFILGAFAIGLINCVLMKQLKRRIEAEQKQFENRQTQKANKVFVKQKIEIVQVQEINDKLF